MSNDCIQIAEFRQSPIFISIAEEQPLHKHRESIVYTWLYISRSADYISYINIQETMFYDDEF